MTDEDDALQERLAAMRLVPCPECGADVNEKCWRSDDKQERQAAVHDSRLNE